METFLKPLSSSISFGLVLWRKLFEKDIEEKHTLLFYFYAFIYFLVYADFQFFTK